VTLQVSSGPQTVQVPDVTGQAETAAALTLVGAGLKTGTVTGQSSTQTPGTVLSQNPAGGSLIPTGSVVNLTVAKQSQQVVVINVGGLDPATAGAELNGEGLKPETSPQPQTVTNKHKNGQVVAQTPGPGSTVKQGSTVTITVGTYSASSSTTASSTSTSTQATTTATTTTSSPAPGAGAAAPSPAQANAAPPAGVAVP
jgi:serine/threonine-protein kinase